MAVVQPVANGILELSKWDTDALPLIARDSEKGRARICAHPDARNPLHEMLIWLDGGSYIRPHRHIGKSESFHLIEGTLRVVLFGDDGEVDKIVRMGTYDSGKTFYYRLESSIYHTVLPDSPGVLIHETTNGPFNPGDAEFPDWAPLESEVEKIDAFQGRLKMSLESDS